MYRRKAGVQCLGTNGLSQRERNSNMKSNLFARPNLKIFLIVALGIAVLQDIITNGRSDTSILTTWTGKPADADRELSDLLAKLEKEPSSELYGRISDCYAKRGDFKSARKYLRRAELSAEIDDE